MKLTLADGTIIEGTADECRDVLLSVAMPILRELISQDLIPTTECETKPPMSRLELVRKEADDGAVATTRSKRR